MDPAAWRTGKHATYQYAISACGASAGNVGATAAVLAGSSESICFGGASFCWLCSATKEVAPAAAADAPDNGELVEEELTPDAEDVALDVLASLRSVAVDFSVDLLAPAG